MYKRIFLILVGSVTLSILIQSVPEVWAFAQTPKTRFLKPRSATNVVQHSSRAQFSLSQTEKRFQDVIESQNQWQIKGGHSLGKQECGKAKPMTIESSMHVPLDVLVFSLDRHKLLQTLATIVLAVVVAYSLVGTGVLIAATRQISRWIHHVFSIYQTLLINNPLRTKVGTGAMLAIVGDALAQSTTDVGAPYDKRRALSFAVFDSCYRVFQHHMFPAVIATCQGKILGRLGIVSSISAAIERTLVYQLLIVPVSGFAFNRPDCTCSSRGCLISVLTVLPYYGTVVLLFLLRSIKDLLLSVFLSIHRVYPGPKFQRIPG